MYMHDVEYVATSPGTGNSTAQAIVGFTIAPARG